MTLKEVPRPTTHTTCLVCDAARPPGSREWHRVLVETRTWDAEGGTATTAKLHVLNFCERCEVVARRIVKALGGAAKDMR
jgi:hypothetical protein